MAENGRHDLRPYPDNRESGLPWLGTIPAHWEVRRNGRLFAQRNQTGFGDLPILEVSLKTGVRVRDFEDSKRKQVMSDREKYKRAAKGDIAYNMMRLWQGAVGTAPVDGLVSPAYVVAQPFEEVDSRYYAYLFRTDAYVNEVNKYSRGIVSDRNRLYWDEFKQMPSPFPPTDEQRAIATFLDHHGQAVRRFIRNRRRLIEVLNEQKQAIIDQAITRGLDPNVRLKPSGIDWLGDVPEHWEVKKLSYLCSLVVDGTHFSPPNGSAGDYLYITAKNIKANGVSLENATFVSAQDHQSIYMRCPVRKGDVLYIKDGATAGVATVNTLDQPFSMLSSVALLRPEPEVMTADYLVLCLNSYTFKSKVLSTVVGGAMTRFTVAMIKQFNLQVPPLDVQRDIVAFSRKAVSPIDNAIGSAFREIALIQEYRNRVIADVVTGKVDVRHLAFTSETVEDEPWDDADALIDDSDAEDPAASEEATDADD